MLTQAADNADCFIKLMTQSPIASHTFYCLRREIFIIIQLHLVSVMLLHTNQQVCWIKKKAIEATASKTEKKKKKSVEKTHNHFVFGTWISGFSFWPRFPTVLAPTFLLHNPPSLPLQKSFWSSNRWRVVCHQFLSCHTAASLCQQMAQMLLWQKAMRGKTRSECKRKTGKESTRKNLTLVSSWQHGRHTCNSFHVLRGRLLDIKTKGSLISSTQTCSSILVLSLFLFMVMSVQCSVGWPLISFHTENG